MLLAASTAHRRRRARTLANRPAADIVHSKCESLFFYYFFTFYHHRIIAQHPCASWAHIPYKPYTNSTDPVKTRK
jgi:hypothetical protein